MDAAYEFLGRAKAKRRDFWSDRHGLVTIFSMDYEQYAANFFVQPAPEPRYEFTGSFGTTLFYEDFAAAVAYFTAVLGPPAYVEGAGTRGWPIGGGWLTLLQGHAGNPQNVEITFTVATPAEADRLHAAFLAAGGQGEPPSNPLMYAPIRYSAVTTPQGTPLLVISPLPTA